MSACQVTNNEAVGAFAARLSTALTAVAVACPSMLMANPTNYCHEFVLRKALIGEDCWSPGAIDLRLVSVDQLKEWCPDKKNHFDDMPDLSGRELSEMLLGRPDHALLLSMWACLWGEVVVKDGSSAKVEEALSQEGVAEHIARYRNEHGVPPHPKVLVDEVLGSSMAKRRRGEINARPP